METIPTSPMKKMTIKFNELKMREFKLPIIEQDSEDDLESQKMKVEIMNYGEIYEHLSDYVFKEDYKKAVEIPSNEFGRTRYVSNGAFIDFFSKLHKNNETIRKGTLVNKTPSFNFIESVRVNRLVPNPIGLLKRDGEDNKLNLKYIQYILLLVIIE